LGDETPISSPIPQNFPAIPARLSDEVIAKVPSRYYQVPPYFFTVLAVAHSRWYRPTLIYCLCSHRQWTKYSSWEVPSNRIQLLSISRNNGL